MRSLSKVIFLFCMVASFVGGVMADAAISSETAQLQSQEDMNKECEPCETSHASDIPDLSHAGTIMSAINGPAYRQLSQMPHVSLEQAEAFLEEALATDDFTRRSELLLKIEIGLDVEDIPKGLGFADRIPTGYDHDNFINNLVGRWAEKDLTGAMTYAQTLSNSQLKADAIMRLP